MKILIHSPPPTTARVAGGTGGDYALEVQLYAQGIIRQRPLNTLHHLQGKPSQRERFGFGHVVIEAAQHPISEGVFGEAYPYRSALMPNSRH